VLANITSDVRNGADYKAGHAQHHLEQMLNCLGDRVRTAEELIRYCATQSSMSDQRCQIRFADDEPLQRRHSFRSG
jgi:hypothetical protein